MKTWTRAAIETKCGRCGAWIPVGDPLLRLVTGLVKLPRCARCANAMGLAIPSDLPPFVPKVSTITPIPKRSAARRLPLIADQLVDVKARAAGDEPPEREPGCDDE